MAEQITERSVLVVIKEYFGMSAAECSAEVKKLTAEDRAWFRDEFRKMGYAVRD